jgi:integration host factor subunit beta
MIKSQLDVLLSQELTQLSEKKIQLSTKLIIEHLAQTLADGGRIEIRGFGSFSLHHRAPRQAFNPKTGTRAITEAKFIPHFKPGKELKEGVDASKSNYPILQEAD